MTGSLFTVLTTVFANLLPAASVLLFPALAFALYRTGRGQRLWIVTGGLALATLATSARLARWSQAGEQIDLREHYVHDLPLFLALQSLPIVLPLFVVATTVSMLSSRAKPGFLIYGLGVLGAALSVALAWYAATALVSAFY